MFKRPDILEAMRVPVRVEVLWRIARSKDGMSVGKIAEAVSLTPDLTSYHLRHLRNVGLVTCEKQARGVHMYSATKFVKAESKALVVKDEQGSMVRVAA